MKSRNFILIVLGMIVLTLCYVRSRFLVVELSYYINEKGAEKRALEKKKRELNLELSVLQSPRRIEEKAKQRFGLKYDNEGFQKKVFMKSKSH
jgi:cell division protein FtsL